MIGAGKRRDVKGGGAGVWNHYNSIFGGTQQRARCRHAAGLPTKHHLASDSSRQDSLRDSRYQDDPSDAKCGQPETPRLGSRRAPNSNSCLTHPSRGAYDSSLGIAAVLPEEKHRRDGGSAGRLGCTHWWQSACGAGAKTGARWWVGCRCKGSPLTVRVGWE